MTASTPLPRTSNAVLDEAGVDRSRVIGAVMGLPAPITRASGTVQDSSILPGWVGVDAMAEASERLGMQVAVENDANLGALAELVWGAAKGYSEIAYLKVASGIGGGLISDGRLTHGVGGTAGEIGHTVLVVDGPVCRCGNRGCLETLASARAVANELSLSRQEQISTRRLLELSESGDPAAQRLIHDAGRTIGVAVANLCNLVNPECVVIGGDLGLRATSSWTRSGRWSSATRSRAPPGYGDRRGGARRAGGDAGGPGTRDAGAGALRRARAGARRHDLGNTDTKPTTRRE